MSDIKTGLMYSELTQCVYWGRINTKTGIAQGNKKDVTSDFIGTMLQKFPINTRQNITNNGKVECVVIVVNEEKADRYERSKDMEAEIAQLKADKAELLTEQKRLQGMLYDALSCTGYFDAVSKGVYQIEPVRIYPQEGLKK